MRTVKRWWRYSRTIFLNVLAVLAMVAGEITAFLTTFDWASVVTNPRAVGYILLAVNVLNIVLRLDTHGPVGGKEDA